MFKFEHIEHLFALGIIPALILFFLLTWYARKQAMTRLGERGLIDRLMPDRSRYKHPLKFILLLLAMSLLILGWANPQWGTKKEKVSRKSVDVFIALDISQSMLAEDILPNRQERAKQFAQKLVNELKGERIGLILFAGNAYLQMPLTTDYAAALLFLRSANPSMAPSQGTAISEAIDLAERSFEEDNKHHKAIIVITDGENHEADAVTRAQEARENGLLVFTIGVGTSSGALIPTTVGGRRDVKRDRTGNPVTTKLNEQMLQEIASAGDGRYYNMVEGDQVFTALREGIDKIEKREIEQRSFNEFESYFQYFIGLGLLLIIIEFLISYRKSKWLLGRDIFKV